MTFFPFGLDVYRLIVKCLTTIPSIYNKITNGVFSHNVVFLTDYQICKKFPISSLFICDIDKVFFIINKGCIYSFGCYLKPTFVR